MSDIAIRVDGLSKLYRIGTRNRYRTLRDVLAQSASAPWRRLRGAGNGGQSQPASDGMLWALQDLSFEVPPGQVLGVIGRNGAGKSTLLKILSRIVEPTRGTAEIRGRVGSLLEVGTGFHPELTGRENVFLNGAILGMRKAEIARKFDEIVAFAELDQFLDTPVKHYSSGMYMRLAFAVAAHLETQVLLVDEVLAVGDAQFQRRCMGKMGDVARSGRTVVFTSHQLEAIQRLCSRCLYLAAGQLVKDGPSSAVVGTYLSEISSKGRPSEWIDLSAVERRGSGEVRFTAVQYASDRSSTGFQPYTNGPLELTLGVHSPSARTVGSLAVTVYSQLGTRLINADTRSLGRQVELAEGRNYVRVRLERLPLNRGVYRLGLRLADPIKGRYSGGYDFIESAFEIEVLGDGTREVAGVPEGAVFCEFSVGGVTGGEPPS